jgi:hypothetical protein
MPERSSASSAISISLPTELLEQIDKRADALGLARSQYLALLASNDLRVLGPLIINGKMAHQTQKAELAPEDYDFLLAAIPALANFEKRLAGKEIDNALPAPPPAVTVTKLWQDFLDRRQEILKYKWIESQKAGRDIGIEQAIRDWVLRHAAEWAQHHPAD